MNRKLLSISMLIVLFSLVLAACAPATSAGSPAEVAQPTAVAGSPTQPAATASTQFPTIDPADTSGDINVAGSSTVYPLAVAVADQFKAEGFNGNINIAVTGTGAGFERFCKSGETDISNASRAITDSEVANCAALNPPRTPIAFRVGTDALTVVVNKDNTFANDITLVELAHLMTDAKLWSDVRAGWPAEPIQRFVPGFTDGTFAFMVEYGIQKPLNIAKAADAQAAAVAASNLQSSEDDNVNVQGVEGSLYAVSFFGFAYFKNQESKLNALTINGIAPSLATAEDGTYPLARPLFIYSDASIMKAKPQVAAFIAYFLTNVDSLIQQVGYAPASQDALNASKQAYLDAMK